MKKPPNQTKIAMKKHFSHFRKTSFSFSRRCSADSVAYIASSEVYHGSSEDIYNKKSSIIPRSSGQLLKTLGCQRSLTAKSSSFEKKAHRSKSLTQIDCLDPNSQRLMKGDGLDASGTGTGSRHQQSRLSSHKCDSSPESANSVLNDLHYSSDRLVVPSLHHTSSLVIDDEDNVRRFKHHHHHSTLSHPDYLTLSLDQYKSDKTEESYISSSKGAPFSRVRKGYLEESGSSISQDGTLKSSKGSRGQLTRRSGGIFSNPFKTDREKMDQLTELLNQYSQHGIPEQMGLLNFKLDSDLDDYGGGITVSSGVGGGICHVSGSCESSVSLSDESLYLEDHWRVIVTNWESMPKKLQNQQDAIWELLHTEVFYIKRLKVISDLFLSCLCNLQSECLLNDIDTEKMFSNITEVYSSNHYFWVNHLLPMLKASRENHQPLNPIIMKDGFLKFEEIFHPYVKYCLEHSNCLQYVKEKHKESELFKAYVVWCETRKDCDRLRLMDLLVKPMQRLTKYSLLLKAILKKTEAEDQKAALKQMNENVEKFVCRVDACLRRRHDQEKLASIVSRIESYDALDSSNDEVEKVLKEFTRLNLTCPMPGCLNHRIRQLLLEGSGLKIRDSYTSSKLDVHCFLFTDILLICKSVGRKGDKVRVIRQPFLVDRIVTHELKDGSGFIVIYLNEFNVASAFFTLYTTETRTWLELIKRAQDHYREAKQQSALYTANQSSSLYRSTVDDGDEDSDFPSTALLVTNTSPRSSRSSLMHSASGSMDISDSNLALGSSLAIAPSTTPNLLLSQNYGATENDGLPSRAISFELGELRNPSMTADDLEPFGRSHSMETRPPPISVTVTSPRPERRAFLLRGAGGSERSGYEPMYGSNTLSVNVPSLHVNKQSLSSCSTSSGSTSAVSRSTGPAETSIQVPVLSKQSQHHHHQQITKSSTSPTSSSSASSIPAGARQRSISPRSLQRSLPVTGSSYSVTTKPPLVKMKNITGTGLKVHSAPPSEGPSPVHSFDSEGNEMLGPLSGSDGHIETSSACHSGHPTGYVSSVISIGGSSSFSGGYTGTNNNPSNASFGNKQNMATMTEESDLEAAKSRLHQKRSVRGERRYHTADSIENMKKEKDSSIHKRLSWNFGQQSGRQSSGSMGQTSGGHERVLCNKHFNKCLSSESVYTSSGFSSTGSVPLSVTSCECDQCGIEVLSHIQEIEGSAESPTTSTKELSEHNLNKRSPSKDTGECSNSRGPNGNGNEPGTVGTSDIKIDVSEVKDGISSVQITVSGANLGKPSKSDLKKMKEFLLTSLEASEV